MSKLPRHLLLCLLFLCVAGGAACATDYDDCILACNQSLQACIEQAPSASDNAQEGEDAIASCNKTSADCRQACGTPEALSPAPPPAPQEPPAETLNGTIKIYKFNE